MQYGEYDISLLKEAYENVKKVYESNYGTPKMGSEQVRLLTVMNKLEDIISKSENKKG